jgi:hypothetical protein
LKSTGKGYNQQAAAYHSSPHQQLFNSSFQILNDAAHVLLLLAVVSASMHLMHRIQQLEHAAGSAAVLL